MIQEETVDEFIDKTTKAMSFLQTRHGFAPPSVEIDRRVPTVTVSFVKGEVAIEAIHDLRDGDVDVKVVRLDAGQKPDGWNVDRQGRRCRATLLDILRRRGIRGFGLKAPTSDEDQSQRFDRLLHQYGRLLESHAIDILSGSAAALDSLDTRRDSITGT